MIPPPRAPEASPAPAAPRGGEDRYARLRRSAMAWLLGAAVIVFPAWPSAAQFRSARPPAFERALRWRDIVRMRLSPWLLMQEAEQRPPGTPPTI